MARQETRGDVDIFAKLTTGRTTLARRRNTTVTVRETAPPPVNVTALPTGQRLDEQGCIPVTTQVLPELALGNQPKVQDLIRVVTALEKQKLLSTAHEEEDRLPELIIENILITPWSAEGIQEMGEAEITSAEDQGLNTINDPRMGTVKIDELCATCHKDNIECPGHYGYVNLNHSIYHPLFIRTTIKVLNCVCNSCGGLLLSAQRIDELGLDRITSPGERLDLLEKNSLKKPCTRQNVEGTEFVGTQCQDVPVGQIVACVANPEYLTSKSKETGKILYRCHGDKTKKEYERPVEKVLQILNGISEEDARLLGFAKGSHPSQYIMRALLVIPPCIRSPTLRDGVIGADPIGTIYKDIIKANQAILLATEEKDINEAERRLIFYISHLIDNTDGKYGRGKTKFKSFKEKIQSKKGIIRGSSMGKRVDFTARTVIGPDPSLKFNQIRLPEAWRPYLTTEVTVANFNQEAMTELLRKGEVTHVVPGTGHLKGRRIKVDERVRTTLSLQPGDKIDRWAQEGDWAIANRQPTIHKQGMMGHEIVFGPDLTVQLPLTVTTPYNADFDGDEMNIHMVQTLEATAEVMGTMDVRQCIMNAQTNKPIMAPVMDSLTAAYKLTQPNVMVDQDTWFDCWFLITAQEDLPTLAERLKRFNVRPFSGKALFSSLLPGDFFYRRGDVTIIDGILISGVIDKDTIGTTHGSIVQELWKRYGMLRTVDFLTDVPRVLDRWLTDVGFTVGLEDCYPTDPKHQQVIGEEIERAKLLVQQLGVKLQDPLEEERREREIIGYLNRAKDIGSRVSKENLRPDNALNIMALSGAKGSTFNIAQITTLLGQQFVRGKRMPEAITGGKRALPYFEEGDLDPEARGFVINSFVSGMTPAELFFHQAGGREGLMDTAIKTAETGTLHHRIVKALENITVGVDGSVRNSSRQIIQPTYGEDGFDAGELQFVPFGDDKIPFFINLDQVSGQINAKYGYYPDLPGTI